MKTNIRFHNLIIPALTSLVIATSWAQPFKYTWDLMSFPEGKIYRANLTTGEIDTIISSKGAYEHYILNPSQTRLFLNLRKTGIYRVVDPEKPDLILKEFNTHGGTIIGVLDGPDNKMYVSGWFAYYEGDTIGFSGSYIVDRNTLAIIDSTTDSEINLMQDGFHNRLRSFFSRDKSYLYTFVYNDKSGVYFDIASTREYRRIGRKQCGSLGGFVYGPSLGDARNGYAVISFERDAGIAHKRYAICDVDSGTIKTIIPFASRANVYLTADTRHFLIEKANWNEASGTKEDKPGTVYVYESQSGRIIQKFDLPPQGEILIFDNYPNMLYYYLPGEQRSINIDLSKLSTINSISPSSVYAGSGSFPLTVLGKNFTASSIVHWNGTPRATTFVSDSVLQVSILTSDVAAVDSPLVTVRNTDGAESSGIRFSVKARPTVQALIDTLRAHLQQALAFGWIGEKKYVQSLNSYLMDAKSKYVAKDSIGCTQELELFRQSIRAEYLSMSKKQKKQFVTATGYQYLYGSAGEIIGSVLTLPPRSGAPLLDRIAALKTQIRIDAGKGFLGGEVLLRGLELILDGARQQLMRKDSTGTALYLMLFRDIVEETYEISKKLPKSRLFVKGEGYISLYHRAGYILEGLSVPMDQPVPKLSPELDQEMQKFRKEAQVK
jgi:hypothetical protein